ncbi:MAG: transcription termination/antitermination protein NusG [Pirellulales bacterium]
MQDEHENTMEDLADDAESNRSDDTALEDENQDAGSHEFENGQPTEQHDSADEPARSLTDADDVAVSDASGEDASLAEPAADAEPAEFAEQVDVESAEEVEVVKPSPARAPSKKREPEPEEEIRMDWYILKVQSNRERSISEALERKMRIEGLDRYFDQVIVPTEKVTEFKGGKKKVVERKLYPGYIVVHMHINDDTWFAVRETSGVGDFTGAGGKPTPMLPHEVARIVQTEEEETSETPKLDIKFSSGDKVKVKEGNFENFEGEVSTIDEASGRVVVMINIFGRSTPVELEYWQIEMM